MQLQLWYLQPRLHVTMMVANSIGMLQRIGKLLASLYQVQLVCSKDARADYQLCVAAMTLPAPTSGDAYCIDDRQPID